MLHCRSKVSFTPHFYWLQNCINGTRNALHHDEKKCNTNFYKPKESKIFDLSPAKFLTRTFYGLQNKTFIYAKWNQHASIKTGGKKKIESQIQWIVFRLMGESVVTGNAHPRGVIVIDASNFSLDYDLTHSNLFIETVILGYPIELFSFLSFKRKISFFFSFFSGKIKYFRHLKENKKKHNNFLSNCSLTFTRQVNHSVTQIVPLVKEVGRQSVSFIFDVHAKCWPKNMDSFLHHAYEIVAVVEQSDWVECVKRHFQNYSLVNANAWHKSPNLEKFVSHLAPREKSERELHFQCLFDCIASGKHDGQWFLWQTKNWHIFIRQ